MNLYGKDFLKLLDFTPDEINYLIDLAAALKAAPETFGIPVVAVTADTQVDSANFDGILFKPITIQKVSDIVGRFAG